MNSRTKNSVVFLITATLIACSTGTGDYIPPEADLRTDTKPCIDGKISVVDLPTVELLEFSGGQERKKRRILVTKETQIFTAYGGYVDSGVLVPGIFAKVWFTGDSCKTTSLPATAKSIEVAARVPDLDWPE